MRLTIGWVLLLITNLASLSFGASIAVYPRMAAPCDEAMLRALGVATIGMGLFGAMITAAAYRRRERWSWFALWYLPFFWLAHLTGELPPGHDRVHQLVLLAMSLLGLTLPFKEFGSARVNDAAR